MQGTHIPPDPRIPPGTFDAADFRRWYATLPQIGRTSHAIDAWREIDAMQSTQSETDPNA